MGVFNNFPYANFHELNADWIIEQVRKVMDDWEEYKTDMDLWKLGVDDQLAEFRAWFDNLDVQDEVRTVINELIQSGEFIEIAGPQIVSATEAWLAAHITPTTPAVDDTLSISGAAADAKVTGDRISDLKEDLEGYSEYLKIYNYDNRLIDKSQFIVGQNGTNGYVNTGINANFRTSNTKIEIQNIRIVVTGDVTNMYLNFQALDANDNILGLLRSGYAIPSNDFTLSAEWIRHNDRFPTAEYIRVNFYRYYGVVQDVGNADFDIIKTSSNVSEKLSTDETGLINGTFFKTYVVGNIYPFAEDKIENGYYQNSNGTLRVTNSSSMRGFIIEVSPNNDYICAAANFVVLLDENKRPITQEQIDYRYQTQFNVRNARYIALSYNNSYPESTYAICKGDTLVYDTKYEIPYIAVPPSEIDPDELDAAIASYIASHPISGTDNRPKASVTNVVVRIGNSNIDDGGNYIVFEDVCHQYDHNNKITGNIYALETALPGRTNQRIFKSIDGGLTWDLVTSLTCDVENGVKWTNIFVTAKSQTFVLLRENSESSHDVVTYAISDFTNPIGTLNIGSKYWHDSTHNIDYSFRNPTEYIMFAEYGKNTESEYYVWRSSNLGATWSKVKTDVADGGTPGSGDIKHYHTCQYLEDTNEWLLSSGDTDSQCKFWTSSDNGTTWTLRGSGSQDYRFLGVCYDSNYLYWGTDAPTALVPTKLIRCSRSTYEIQTVVEIPHNNAIYGITRVNIPNGILMVPQHEPASAAINGITKVVFYSFDKDALYNVADIPNIGVSDANYIGFETASKFQDIVSGSIFGVMTTNLAYANASNKSRYHVSKICRINLTMIN